ncbi:MAG: DUF4126 domain-containing protein [Chloroflexi bacterium]|nr:DUF4126 domain-containing protein [Chloroflexota bacterium]
MTQILTAFGLSASAGLNAYIPLLIIALTARFTDWVKLSTPFDLLTNEWVISVIIVLLLIETLADKIPVVDHINDVIQTIVRPTAGAILFAANANILRDVHPLIPIVAGLIVAGTVHATKATARPVVNMTTFGMGAPVISVVEDVISFLASLTAIFAPFLVLVFAALFVFVVYKLLSRRRRSASA